MSEIDEVARSEPPASTPRKEASAILRMNRGAVIAGSVLGAIVLLIVTVPRLGAQPLWLDEAYSLGVVNQFAIGTKRTGGTMIGYYALLWVWAHVSESPAWLRSLSLLLGVAVMPVVAGIGRLLGGRRLAVIAPPLLASALMFQDLAIEARGYTLEILIVTVSWYALIRAVDAGVTTPAARRWWVLLTLVAPWGVFAHGLYVLFLVTLVVGAVLSPQPRRVLAKLVPMLGASAVLLTLLLAQGVSSVGDWVPDNNFNDVRDITYRYIGQWRVFQAITVASFIGLAMVAGRDLWRARRARAEATGAWHQSIPVLWFALPPLLLIAGSVVRPEFIDRYFSPILPAWALMIGLAGCRAFDWMQERFEVGSTVSLSLFGVLGLLVIGGFTTTNFRAINDLPAVQWDQVAAKVHRDARVGDGILLYSDFSRVPLEAAWADAGYGAGPRPLNMSGRIEAVKRIRDHHPISYTWRRRLLSFDRIWTITVGSEEVEPPFYETTPPLTTNYRRSGQWHFTGYRGTIEVRLYERTTPVDFHPATR